MSDSEYTEVVNKKTSRLAYTAFYMSVVASIAGMLYVACDQAYWDSLKTDQLAGKLSGVLGASWFLFSAMVILLFLVSFVWILSSDGRLTGIGIVIIAVVIVAFVSSIVMPNFGLAYYVRYRRIANGFVYQTYSQPNTTSFSSDKYNIEVVRNDSYAAGVGVVEVCYTLKDQVDSGDYPKEFKVLLNFDTGEKSIQEGDLSSEN